jgi:hypothetical protein
MGSDAAWNAAMKRGSQMCSNEMLENDHRLVIDLGSKKRRIETVVSSYNSVTVTAEIDGSQFNSVIYCKYNNQCFDEALKLERGPGYHKPGTWQELENYMLIAEKCKGKDRILWQAEFNYKSRATICPIIPVNSYIDLADRDEKKNWFLRYSKFTVERKLPVTVVFTDTDDQTTNFPRSVSEQIDRCISLAYKASDVDDRLQKAEGNSSAAKMAAIAKYCC